MTNPRVERLDALLASTALEPKTWPPDTNPERVELSNCFRPIVEAMRSVALADNGPYGRYVNVHEGNRVPDVIPGLGGRPLAVCYYRPPEAQNEADDPESDYYTDHSDWLNTLKFRAVAVTLSRPFAMAFMLAKDDYDNQAGLGIIVIDTMGSAAATMVKPVISIQGLIRHAVGQVDEADILDWRFGSNTTSNLKQVLGSRVSREYFVKHIKLLAPCLQEMATRLTVPQT